MREATADDRLLVYKRYLDFRSLVSGGRVVPHWLPDGSSFWYIVGSSNERQVWKIDPDRNICTPLVDMDRLRKALRERLGHDPGGAGLPFERLQLINGNLARIAIEGDDYDFDIETYDLTRVVAPSSSFAFKLALNEADRTSPRYFMRERFIGLGESLSPESVSTDGQWIAGVEQGNLVLRATVDGQTISVTNDASSSAFWDVEGELWNPWSPTGQYLVALRHDTEGVTRVPTVEWLKELERVTEVILVGAGGTLYRSDLYLVDLRLARPIQVDLGDTKDSYVRVLSWLPDGSELLVAVYNRVFSRVDIQAVCPAKLSARTVLVEQSDTFLTNHHEVLRGSQTGFALLPDGSGFIWNSERTGWDHLYLYNMDGQLVRQLTHGEWRVGEVIRIDLAGGLVYFTGHGDRSRPYDLHLYSVQLDGQGLVQLTEGKGRHAVQISPSAQYFTDTYSAVDIPPRTVLRRMNGSLVRILDEADVSRLQALGWTPPQEHVVKASDSSTDLWVTAYLPYDFNPQRKYPVIEYIYGGPQTTARPMEFGDKQTAPWFSFRQENFPRALAQLGFVVVALDARGTPGRSKAFHDMVYRNWGRFEIADHACALRQLGDRLPFLDLKRVGVFGASWGGHFAFRAMTQAPELYKVGISEVPGLDPRRLVVYEPYLGLPQENNHVYDAASPFTLAPRLQGELLLIGGMNDTNTQADLFKLSEILIRLGKQHTAMIYPNSGHLTTGRTADYDLELKRRFFCNRMI